MSRLAPAFMSVAPCEVRMRSPDVMVESVRVPDVTETFELKFPSMEKPVLACVSMVVVAESMSRLPLFRSKSPVVVRSISPEPVASCIWLLPVDVSSVIVPLAVVNDVEEAEASANEEKFEVSIVMLPEESMSRDEVSMSKGTSVSNPSLIATEASMVVVAESRLRMSGVVIMMSPLVSVERVRLPLVAETLEFPVPSMEKAPVESMS